MDIGQGTANEELGLEDRKQGRPGKQSDWLEVDVKKYKTGSWRIVRGEIELEERSRTRGEEIERAVVRTKLTRTVPTVG